MRSTLAAANGVPPRLGSADRLRSTYAIMQQQRRLLLRLTNVVRRLYTLASAPLAEQLGSRLYTRVATLGMAESARWSRLVGVVFCTFTCLANAAPMFNVLGTETKNDVSLQFLISDTTGTALPSESWNSKTTKYQDEATDTFMLLQFWEISFSYDAAKTSFDVTAFHKIDPHSGAVAAGDPFSWSDVRPAATKARGSSGALFGEVTTSDSKDHADSVGAHKDLYTGDAVYITNLLDPATGTRLDQFGVTLTGTHCGGTAAEPKFFVVLAETCACACTVPVSEPSSFALLFSSVFALFMYAWPARGAAGAGKRYLSCATEAAAH
jgi:hypothetical protein